MSEEKTRLYDLNELKIKKNQLERDLSIAINGVINAFEDDTGLTPSSVKVDTLCISEWRKPNRFITGSCSVVLI